MQQKHILAVATVLASSFSSAQAEPAEPLGAVARMPVREITVFKDGHAFVLHEGNMPTDASGNVILDYLPSPVLGTFWPYSSEKSAKLGSVVSSQRRISIPRTALTLKELILANEGAEVRVDEESGTGMSAKVVSYDATILGVPKRTADELEQTSAPNSGDMLPQRSSLVLLKTPLGISAVSMDKIQNITFKSDYKPKGTDEEFRNLLTLKLGWDGGRSNKSAEVGMVYLQKGIRWIPNYKVNLKSDGTAEVKLQATLINELTDLNDVTANLVIGVPSFAFSNQTDPIALQDTMATLSSHFRDESRMANNFSNAIMSQVAEPLAGRPSPVDVSIPEVTDAAKNDDLFIFTAQHITLKKGQRMVVPIAESKLNYKDVYSLEIPFSPPPEVRLTHNPGDAEIARLFNQPKVMHSVRLTNKSVYPLTTAPALIMKENKLIAQGLMTYAAQNAQTDLKLTTAIDIKVKKTEQETKRTPNAIRQQDDNYGRVDLEGKLTLTSYSTKPVEVEIKRYVLGKVSTADNGGKSEMINVIEDANAGQHPHWWGWYDWPYWWNRVNGIGRTSWTVTLQPQKTVDLNYSWYYYWR